MNAYAFYIWSAYALTAWVMGYLAVSSLWRYWRVKKQWDALEKRDEI